MSVPVEASVGFEGAGRPQVSGWALKRRQFLALFIKRFHHVRRSKKGFISEVCASGEIIASWIA